MLDRCFVVSRFNLSNGKDLVLMNTHNSAYDAGGKLRDAEMPIIRDLMIEEYEKGNYVVAGGDWNQNPPGYDFNLSISFLIHSSIWENFRAASHSFLNILAPKATAEAPEVKKDCMFSGVTPPQARSGAARATASVFAWMG